MYRGRISTFRLIALMLLAATVLAGCSANRFIYNRADTFVRWVVDDYVDLNRDQQAAFDTDLQQLLDWHRRDELPQYRQFIVSSRYALGNGVTLQEAVAISESIEAAADRIQIRLVDLLLHSAERLSDRQIQDFLSEVDRQQADYATKRLTRDEQTYYQDSSDSLASLAKRLMGRLSKEQKGLIEVEVAQLTRLDHLWHRDRAVWGAKLRAILERKAPDWQSQVRFLGDTRSQARTPEYIEGIEHNGDIILALLVDLINTRTERQDQHLRRFIGGLINDIDALTVANLAQNLVVEQ
ncbi:MAG: DUF6279 family lipoprotein [Luminiphilus sp.]|nr:DUF6279 family lipoprotein [Luminiphilus sp.]